MTYFIVALSTFPASPGTLSTTVSTVRIAQRISCMVVIPFQVRGLGRGTEVENSLDMMKNDADSLFNSSPEAR